MTDTTKTIELIKKHTEELNCYMAENSEYSFHRFTDGSIYCLKPVCLEKIDAASGILPLRPVRELEELAKAVKKEDALIIINECVKFEAIDCILGSTELLFCNSSVTIAYDSIDKVEVIYDYTLKKILPVIKKGNFGNFVCIEGHMVDTDYLDIMEKGVSFPVINKRGKYMTAYFSYDSINTVMDEYRNLIYRR